VTREFRDLIVRNVLLIVVATAALTSSLFVKADAAVNSGLAVAAVQGTPANPLDPTLSDPAWQKSLTATGFFDLTTRRPAPLTTTAYVLYDAQNIYVAFRCEQSGVSIHAEQTTNGVGFGQDDFVGIGLDPSGDGSQVYYFEASPRGVRNQQSSESTRFDPPWQAAAAVSGTTWTAVMVIPFKVLRAGGGHAWRVSFVRGVAAVGEHYTWAYDGLMADGQPPNYPAFTDARFWPTFNGLAIKTTAARPQPRVELYGLESVGKDRQQFQQASGVFAQQSVRNYGVDFTYPMTNTLAAVGTLDPDFSNVEVDQQTISPQEFRRNLTEYRPFFAQGAQYFNPDQAQAALLSGNQTFYTPNFGPFDRGFKIEGTQGLNAIGMLEARGSNLDGSDFDDTAFGLQHALPDRTLSWWMDGVLANHFLPGQLFPGNDTTLEAGFKGRDNATGFVYAFDDAFEDRLSPSSQFAIGPGIGHQLEGFIDVHKPSFEWLTGYQDTNPYYAPADGFTTSPDLRGPTAIVDFVANPGGAVKNINGFAGADRFLARNGDVHENDVFGNVNVTLADLLSFGLTQQTSGFRFYQLPFPLYSGGTTLPFDSTAINVGYRDGTPAPIDISYGGGPFGNPGALFTTAPTTFYLHQFTSSTSRPLGERFNLQLEYDGNSESFPSGQVLTQQLRRIGIGESFGPNTNVSVALRDIAGAGGFAAPGVNLAVGFHERFRTGSELFVNYGTPAAGVTLDRLIIKYVLRIGGGAGT
jgi:hypothetical protein